MTAKKRFLAAMAAGMLIFGSFSLAAAAKPIIIDKQGSFTVGGT